MTTVSSLPCSFFRVLSACLFVLILPSSARIVADFNAGKTGWDDFSFDPGLPGPTVDAGQFKFVLPPAGQSLFVASTRKSETFELKEGRTIEFRVDLVEGGGKDSFAILAFIPTSTGAQTLAGYGFAKSTTDLLLTKGIGKYFYNEDPAEPIRNDNVVLSLNLSVRNGNVTVTARVLDKANHEAVLFEKIVVDTPAADVMADGNDDPAPPYITQGYFTLYLYQDFDPAAPEDPYKVTLDNAEVFVTDRAVLDDFKSGKNDWEDFSFDAALPLPAVDGGQFKFILPPAGQALFVASTKKSRAYELREGERLELGIDLVAGGGKDSFAILGFIPTDRGAQSLAGYSLSKSTTDILMTKGIGKYFYNENPAEPIRNENVKLTLTLTARGGSVYVTGRVLDTLQNDALLFEKTVVDSPAADVLADGTDEPAAPFITQGYFTLYLYEDFDSGAPETPYQVTYENAVVATAPVAGNPPPIISEVLPASAASFLPVTTVISFKATDDQALGDGALSITLNGTPYTSANGLTLVGAGNARTASLSGVLQSNVTYEALLKVVDAGGAPREQTLKFDTFSPGNFIIEIEDYNFGAGHFIENPVPVPEGAGPADTTYSNQEGVHDTDYSESRDAPNPADTKYRPADPVRMAHSLDKVRQKYADGGGSAAGVYDYDVGDLVSGEWLQYTRTFVGGSYEVYLRQQVVGLPSGQSVLERVTGNPAQPFAATSSLGTFLGRNGGFDYQNTPLTDGAGAGNTVLRLSGTTTLRLRHLTTDPGDGEYRLLNYLVFVPVADGFQRATITSLSPSPDSTVATVIPAIDATIQNRNTSVSISSVKLSLNGIERVGTTVEPTPTGATLNYRINPLPPSGATNVAIIQFKDSEGVDLRSQWQFVITYNSVDPAIRVNGVGSQRGFKIHVVQAPADGPALENSLDRAETQLAVGSPIPRVVDTNAVVDLVNLNKRATDIQGYFDDDLLVPGIDPDTTGNGDNDFAVEMLTYLDLPAGVHRFGVRTDDGYKIAPGVPPLSASSPPLAFHNGGPADETYDLVVSQAGLYAFRMVWYERAGAGHAEWFTVDLDSGNRTLINDPVATGALKAWREIDGISGEVVVEGAPAVLGPFLRETTASINPSSKTASIPISTTHRFFRLRSASALTIKTAQLQAGALILSW